MPYAKLQEAAVNSCKNSGKSPFRFFQAPRLVESLEHFHAATTAQLAAAARHDGVAAVSLGALLAVHVVCTGAALNPKP